MPPFLDYSLLKAPACLPPTAELARQVTPAMWYELLNESDDDGSQFLAFSERGVLDELIPNWQRLRSPNNTQHSTHDFTLDVHTAYVLAKTRRSPYYRPLSYREKQRVVMSAVLHDIAKNTGKPEDKAHMSPDFYHPIKGVPVGRRCLPAFGFSQHEIELISRVIHHHQLFGRMIIRYGKQEELPDAAYFNKALRQLQTEIALDHLLPLTEGDIRSVKAEDKLFSDHVADRLHTYAEAMRPYMQALEASRVKVAFHQGDSLTPARAEAPSQKRFWLTVPLPSASEAPCFCGFPAQETDTLFVARLTEAPPSEPSLILDVMPEYRLALLNLPSDQQGADLRLACARRQISLAHWQAPYLQADPDVSAEPRGGVTPYQVNKAEEATHCLVANPIVSGVYCPENCDKAAFSPAALSWQVPLVTEEMLYTRAG